MKKGFTLIELLVVVAIIGVLATIVLTSLSGARKKGQDARTIETMAQIRNSVELQNGSSNTYANVFNVGTNAVAAVSDLASKLGLISGSYDYGADATGFAMVFPLQAVSSGYWCVDSMGIAKQTTGLINLTGPKSCANATRDPSSGGSGGGGGSNCPSGYTFTNHFPPVNSYDCTTPGNIPMSTSSPEYTNAPSSCTSPATFFDDYLYFYSGPNAGQTYGYTCRW